MSSFIPLAIGASVLIASTAAAQTSVRAVHASPDAPPVNVIVNGGVAVSNLAFTQASPYLNVPPGTYSVGVAAFPATTPIYSENFTLPAGTFTVAAIGLLGGGTFDLAPFADDNTQNPGAARVRFIHASPNAPTVDITLPDGTVLFNDVVFGTSGGYINVPGGTYDLQVRLQDGTVALNVPNVTVQNNTVSTIFAMGLVGGTGAQALAAVPIVDVIPSPALAAAFPLAAAFVGRRRR